MQQHENPITVKDIFITVGNTRLDIQPRENLDWENWDNWEKQWIEQESPAGAFLRFHNGVFARLVPG